ncbi:MAG: YciI family protein [Bacilli bacterium]|nr:YciI family protein [Bacilli bacterium]
MNKKLYLMLMENIKTLNLDVIKRHVFHLKNLDDKGLLYLCGPFVDYGGGMVILKTDTLEEAVLIANADPFIAEGYKTFEIRTLEVANKENGYGL